MKFPRPRITLSLKTIIIGFICLGFTVLVTSVYVIRASFIHHIQKEAMSQTGSQMLASGNLQIDEILPGLLLREEKGALNYILKRIQEKEGLTSIDFHQHAKDAYLGGCLETTARSSLCFDMASNVVRTVHRAEMDGEVLGFLTKEKVATHVAGVDLEKSFLIILLVLIAVFVGLVIWVAFFLERYVRRPILSLEDTLHPSMLHQDPAKLPMATNRVSEIHSIVEQVQGLITKYQNAQTQAALGQFAAQVGHDLISPITSLRMTVDGIEQITASDKIKIQRGIERIRSIATTLREKQKTILAGLAEASDALSTEPIRSELLGPLIEQVVEEKRHQHGKIAINFDPGDLTDARARIQRVEFERVLSNLLDNSAEAIERSGTVELDLEAKNGNLILTIRDNGIGIPVEVLPRLMKQGASFGKESGVGMGLYHAKLSVESWGGKLSIESEERKGTSVMVQLSQMKRAPAYVRNLVVPAGTEVIIVDDSAIVPIVWKDTLEGYTSNIKYFSSTSEFEEWYAKNSSSKNHRIFLVDLDIDGSDIDGLELIQKVGIAKDSILVTGRFDDEEVMARCAECGVRLLPKTDPPPKIGQSERVRFCDIRPSRFQEDRTYGKEGIHQGV